MKAEHIHILTAEEGDIGLRVDQFLTNHLEVSRSRIQKLIELGNVTIGDEEAKSRTLVQLGDTVTCVIPGETDFPLPEDRPLDILFEDEHVIVLNKPVGAVVHPNSVTEEGSMVAALMHYLPNLCLAVYDTENPVSRLRPGIVHRLDKDTSGVLVVAKTREALLNLADQFRAHTVEKVYAALVHGTVEGPETIHTTMRRKPGPKNVMGVSNDPEEGREAITHIEPIEFYGHGYATATLLKCRIETGRTHQIRVHCKHIGHPVLGDEMYTNKPATSLSRHLGAHHQLLHACEMTFSHPVTGERIHIVAPLPQPFIQAQAALTRL